MKTSLFHWLYQRSNEAIRYEGVWIFLGRMLKKILSPVVTFGSYTFYERDLSKTIAPVKPKVALDVERGTEDDVDALAIFAAQNTAPGKRKQVRNLVLDRLHANHLCFLGKVNGQIAHQNWIVFNHYHIPAINRYVVLDKDYASTHW